MRALAFAIAGALLCAVPAHADMDVEVFGGHSWSGNISAGGETNPAETVTMERNGEYAGGIGAGYNSGPWRYGLRVRYWSTNCVGECPFRNLETRQLGILGTLEYTLHTNFIADPFMGVEAGLGYISFVCKGRDACAHANYADAGFLYGVCGGFHVPVTDDYRWKVTAAACHHRNEMVSVSGVPHWDAPSETTAELRVSWGF